MVERPVTLTNSAMFSVIILICQTRIMLYDLLSNYKYGITGACQNIRTDISNQFTNQALAMVSHGQARFRFWELK